MVFRDFSIRQQAHRWPGWLLIMRNWISAIQWRTKSQVSAMNVIFAPCGGQTKVSVPCYKQVDFRVALSRWWSSIFDLRYPLALTHKLLKMAAAENRVCKCWIPWKLDALSFVSKWIYRTGLSFIQSRAVLYLDLLLRPRPPLRWDPLLPCQTKNCMVPHQGAPTPEWLDTTCRPPFLECQRRMQLTCNYTLRK